MSKCTPKILGANPANIKWNVVRGDTSRLLIEFFEDDEKTYTDISDWDFLATAYNPLTNFSDELEVEVFDGKVEIVAESFITEQWGNGFGSMVASLNFDLQVTKEEVVWTPVVGKISVIGDVTGVL
jgi:hypothetical protein